VDGSIPGDLAREEHDRIAHELDQAQKLLATAKVVYAHIEDTLNRALALAGRCDEVYRGGPQIRRLSNQFFFDKLLGSPRPERSRRRPGPGPAQPRWCPRRIPGCDVAVVYS